MTVKIDCEALHNKMKFYWPMRTKSALMTHKYFIL